MQPRSQVQLSRTAFPCMRVDSNENAEQERYHRRPEPKQEMMVTGRPGVRLLQSIFHELFAVIEVLAYRGLCLLFIKRCNQHISTYNQFVATPSHGIRDINGLNWTVRQRLRV